MVLEAETSLTFFNVQITQKKFVKTEKLQSA